MFPLIALRCFINWYSDRQVGARAPVWTGTGHILVMYNPDVSAVSILYFLAFMRHQSGGMI